MGLRPGRKPPGPSRGPVAGAPGGLPGVDQAVAVGVEPPEVGPGAEELAGGDVAVPVAVHPAEPGHVGPPGAGAARGGRVVALHGEAAAVEEGAAADAQLVA